MRLEITGINKVDFTNKETGEIIKGYNFYYGIPFDRAECYGLNPVRLWIKPEMITWNLSEHNIGGYDVEFVPNGNKLKLTSIKPVK